MTAALRIAACLVAIAAAVDPAVTVDRALPPIVDVRMGRAAAADPRALDLRARLATSEDEAVRAHAGVPSAVVLIGAPDEASEGISQGVPVSFVELQAPAAQRVRIRRVNWPAPVLPGQTAVVVAELEAPRNPGASSVVTLEHQGIELARTRVQWAPDTPRQTAELAYAPPQAGVHALRVVVRPEGESGAAGAAAVDVAIVAVSRELRVLTYEPRPSWAAAFVRRVIESDAAFAPASLARTSRGIDVRGGTVPEHLTAAALQGFDAVVVGAPEALSEPEVQALEAFARVRGGAVVLLPDRRPSRAFLRLLPVARFDERLVDKPLLLQGASGVGIRATEFALPRDPGPDASIIAAARFGSVESPVIVSWPLGAGRLVFSGALDAWRYRAEGDGAFGRFWAGLAANLAAAAPRALQVSAQPALAAPGDRVTVRAVLRQTEWTRQGDRIELPPISASLIGSTGAQQPIRLWPTAEIGVFEGRVIAPAAGQFDVRAASGALTADATLVVAAGAQTAGASTADASRALARATGGVTVSSDDLGPLEAHLRALRPDPVPVTLRPMRSPWWMVAFAGTLCAEWALRRRRGDR